MPLSLRRGTVTAVLERHEGLVRAEVDGDPCVAYPELTGPVALGDEVLVNTQARELGLGSGGFDVAVREPDARSRARAGGGAHVDEAAVHARSVRRAVLSRNTLLIK